MTKKTKITKTKTTASTPGKTFRGVVVSNKMDKTLIIAIDMKRPHPKYKKIMKKTKKLYIDDNLKANIGDQVLVRETRPISKLKRFTTLKILS